MAENWNDNWLRELSIRNFKSIKEVDLKCGRINVFIGEPNVGKSNILEAIALLSGEIVKDGEKFGVGGIRFEKTANLFYEQKFKDLTISISSDSHRSSIYYVDSGFNFLLGNFEAIYRYQLLEEAPFKNLGDLKNLDLGSFITAVIGSSGDFFSLDKQGVSRSVQTQSILSTNINQYRFKPFKQNNSSRDFKLSTPFGDNLFSVIESHSDLRDEVGEFIRPFGYTFVLDPVNEVMSMQKLDGMYAISTPYSMIADTLQRMIFHFAAIYSNYNSVLLFEEPESHSFPPYIDMLAERIVASETNQFFMTTHSPFILDKMMSYSDTESVAIHYVYYEEGQSKIKTLSEAKIQELLDNGVDVFFNMNWLKD